MDTILYPKTLLTIFSKFTRAWALAAKKIFSAAKFIDYFVHDILDYTILNEDQKNFMKNTKFCDARDAIEEIVVI